MPMLVPNASHHQKFCSVPHVSYLDPTNEMVPLMMPLVSHNPDAGANGIT